MGNIWEIYGKWEISGSSQAITSIVTIRTLPEAGRFLAPSDSVVRYCGSGLCKLGGAFHFRALVEGWLRAADGRMGKGAINPWCSTAPGPGEAEHQQPAEQFEKGRLRHENQGPQGNQESMCDGACLNMGL